MENKNVSLFFEVSNLNEKNFSFDDLILRYYHLLEIYRDEKCEYYSELSYLYFVVFTFSEIMKQTFSFEEDIIEDDLIDYACRELFELKNSVKKGKTVSDGIFAISAIVIDELDEKYDIEEDDDVSEIILVMLENIYRINEVNKTYSGSLEEETNGVQKKKLMS